MKSGKTLRRVNPAKKMQEMDKEIFNKCVEEQRINHVYNDNEVVQTNEVFEVINKKKDRKRVLKNQVEESSDSSFESGEEQKQNLNEYIEEYNNSSYHELHEQLSGIYRKCKGDVKQLSEEDELLVKDLEK